MDPVVDISFDCLPLRSVGRVDVPLDASPAFRARCERLKQAIDAYDNQNAYFLYNTQCTYRLANSEIATRAPILASAQVDRLGDLRVGWVGPPADEAGEHRRRLRQLVVDQLVGVPVRGEGEVPTPRVQHSRLARSVTVGPIRHVYVNELEARWHVANPPDASESTVDLAP